MHQRLLGRSAIIAYQQHVAAGRQRRIDPLRHAAHRMGTGHGQIIAEDYPAKAQLSAQDVLQPTTGEAGGQTVHRRIDHVRRHDPIQ